MLLKRSLAFRRLNKAIEIGLLDQLRQLLQKTQFQPQVSMMKMKQKKGERAGRRCEKYRQSVIHECCIRILNRGLWSFNWQSHESDTSCCLGKVSLWNCTLYIYCILHFVLFYIVYLHKKLWLRKIINLTPPSGKYSRENIKGYYHLTVAIFDYYKI